MPATVDRGSLASYARFPPELDRDWLGRVCHLSRADPAVIRRRTDPVTQLGYATQLVAVRAIGTFQSDPAAVPEPVVAAVAHQLGIDDPGVLAGYRDMPVRWRHTAEIRDRYGYRDFATQPGRFAFTAWLYRQAWADEVASSVLFRAAHRQLLARRILLPGHSVLMRLVATVRERATHRVHSRAGYTCCVLDQLRTRLRRRDIYAPGSTRWGDPRAELLTPQTWADQRETLCDALALEPEPATVIGQLSAALDAAWRRTATGYAANRPARPAAVVHRPPRPLRPA